MSYGKDRARYEAQLARAHGAMFYAAGAAESMGDEGAYEDATAILREITRLGEDSIRREPRRRRQVLPGQLETPNT